jgi:hypothetical protein
MYFPQSQIKSNLYTNGDEYRLSTTKEYYKGYYYEISTGQKYTGKTPQDGFNIELISLPPLSEFTELKGPSTSTEIIFTPEDLSYSPLDETSRNIPFFNPTLPTDQDKQNGQFMRYFCTKNNELRYFEIDKLTYDKLSNRSNQIAWDLYSPASLTWRIKGNQEQVFNSNKGAAISLERNLRWVGFPQYFRDRFLQYYLES